MIQQVYVDDFDAQFAPQKLDKTVQTQLAAKELGRGMPAAVVILKFPILQKVPKDLDEVALARAEEPGNPHTGPLRGAAPRFDEGVQYLPEVAFKGFSWNILVHFRPDLARVMIGDLDHALQGTERIEGKQVGNAHSNSPLYRTARI